MSAVRRLGPVVVFAFGAACQGTEGEPDAGQQLRAAVTQELAERMREYGQALLGGNAAEVKAFWSEDTQVLLPGLDLDGTALASFVDDFFGGGGRVLSVEFRTRDVFVHGDAAYELGQYEETAQFGDQTPETVSGNYFLRWERHEDESWRIGRFVAGPIAAPEGT